MSTGGSCGHDVDKGGKALPGLGKRKCVGFYQSSNPTSIMGQDASWKQEDAIFFPHVHSWASGAPSGVLHAHSMKLYFTSTLPPATFPTMVWETLELFIFHWSATDIEANMLPAPRSHRITSQDHTGIFEMQEHLKKFKDS